MAAPTRTELVAYARQAALSRGVDPDILVAQIDQESGFNPNAVGPQTRYGRAQGIAQLMPQYYPNVDPTDPYASIDAMADTDARNLKAFGGNYALMLAAYDAGAGAVQQAGGVPNIPETRTYVHNIMGAAQGTQKSTLQDGAPTDTSVAISSDDAQQATSGSSPASTSDSTSVSAQPSTSNDSSSPTRISPGGYSPSQWDAIVQAHGGILGVSGPTKTMKDTYGRTVPDPSSVNIITFQDGTSVQVKYLPSQNKDQSAGVVQVIGWPGQSSSSSSQKPLQVGVNTKDAWIATYDSQGVLHVVKNPNYVEPNTQQKPQTVGTNIKDPYIVQRGADGSYTQVPNPNYVAPSSSADLQPVLDPNTGAVIALRDPKTGQQIRLPKTAPTVVSYPDGSKHQWDPQTGQWTELAPPDPLTQQETQTRIAAAQRALQPEQQKLITDATATIQTIKQRVAAGLMSPDQATAMMQNVWDSVNAGLQGTTIFQQQTENERKKEALQALGSKILGDRISSGTSLADSILRAATSGHLYMPPGKTTLGIDPFAMANQETTQLGGGQQVYDLAQQMLQGSMSSDVLGLPGLGAPPQAQSSAFPITREAVLAKYPELARASSVAPAVPQDATPPNYVPPNFENGAGGPSPYAQSGLPEGRAA